ncbi:ComEC/Rec2 family competence protein [Zhihengliuella salsuginis]|uniref:Metallo-beta-lactamase domain-containing protein n=1 Tax=Zhihengliuella salsuginis TaxID=578222 RepID=A0ABQ3GCY7_9MICC|nr:ComEC/Rec2 family competence protein [Zhihengliuella salsuginis]GHD02067.1 hypothetical protein GCM10008096_06920 [Zhihengliuella salsuginis]
MPTAAGDTHRDGERARFDARGIWAVAGAWGTALALGGADAGAAGWAAAGGVGLLFGLVWLLVRNQGLIAWSHHLWGPAAATLAGATLVASTVALAGPANSGLARLAEHVAGGPTVRIETELTGDALPVWKEDVWSTRDGEPASVPPAPRPVWDAPPPRPDGLGTRAGPGRWELAGAATVQRFWSRGRWHEADVPVYLRLAPAAGTPERPGPLRAGTRIFGFATLQTAEDGMNHSFWATMGAGSTIVESDRSGLVHQLRDRFVERSQGLPAYGSALLPGMVMGDRSGQSEQLDEAMKVTGLAHLTAVSGANCAFIMGAVLWLLRLARCPRWLAFAGAAGSLAGFVVLVGFDASVVRAAVMGAIAATAVFVGRGRQAFAALCACSVILLGLNPGFARDPAFQLSVLATAGIVVMGRPMAGRLARLMPGWLAQGVAISLSAQLSCQPVLVALQPRLATYGVLANLVVAPLVPVITVAGTAGLVTAALPGHLSQPLVQLSGWLAHLVGLLGTEIADWPGASVPWPEGGTGSGLAAALATCAAFAVWAAARRATGRGVAGTSSRNRTGPAPGGGPWGVATAAAVTAGAALIAGVVLPATPLMEPPARAWNIAACDVGQGDALLLRTGTSAAVAIDVGDDPEALLACLDRVGVEALDAVFISHLHADHVGALAGVLARHDVGVIYYSTARPFAGTTADPPARLGDLVGGSGAGSPPIRRLVAGDRGAFEKGEFSLAWEVLWPRADSVPGEENDASLVMDLLVGESGARARMLATGDIEEQAMSVLLRERPDLRTDVLKVSHHGAANGGTEALETSLPGVGLVSVGRENTYGHPSPRVVEAYAAAGVPLLRTDERGTVLVDLENGSGAGRLTIRAIGPRRANRRDRIVDRRHRGGIHGRSEPTARWPARRRRSARLAVDRAGTPGAPVGVRGLRRLALFRFGSPAGPGRGA